MEAFYGRKREGEVKTAGGSVVAYERWRETGDQQILDEIEDYNRIDCISTEELRDWLVGIRPAGPWPTLGAGCGTEGGRGGCRRAGVARGTCGIGLCPRTGRRCCSTSASSTSARPSPRNGRCSTACGKDEDDLIDDLDALAGLEAIGPAEPVKQSMARTLSLPAAGNEVARRQEARRCRSSMGRRPRSASRTLDRTAREITVKAGPAKAHLLTDRLTLHPDWPLNTDVIAAALRDVIADQCGPRGYRAVDDLLSRAAPRLTTGHPDLPVADPVAGTIAAVGAMDETVLPIQGPPGTGKTYVTARAILSLVREGRTRRRHLEQPRGHPQRADGLSRARWRMTILPITLELVPQDQRRR